MEFIATIRVYVWCLKDKCPKCKGKLQTTVQHETVSKTDHNFVPNLAGMEFEV